MPVSYINSRRIIFIFILLEFFILLMAWWMDGPTLTGLQTATRFSGRLSLMLFSFIFLFYQRRDIMSRWLSDKSYLLFAVVHGIHLAELFAFTLLSGTQLVFYRVVGGFIACVLIFAMPVFQYRMEKGKMRMRKFEKIETVYIYYIWFIFFMTYLPRVQGTMPNLTGNYKEYVLLLGWVSTLLGYKISSLMRYRSKNRNL